MGLLETPKLHIRRIQESDQFADESFNKTIDDIDNKVLGIGHLKSPGHWAIWEAQHYYNKGDIVRYSSLHSYQYVQYIESGQSALTEPTNNVTDSIVSDGTAKFIVCDIGSGGGSGGILIWLSGQYYQQGQSVLYGTSLYRVKNDHTSTNFFDDYDNWQEIYSSIRLWLPNIFYYIDDTVIHDNIIYKCVAQHTSESTFDSTEEERWRAIGSSVIVDWVSGMRYSVGQIVKYKGVHYVVKEEHISNDFQEDGKCEPLEAIYYEYEYWEFDTYYSEKYRVRYANRIWENKTAHQSSTLNFNTTEREYWDPVDPRSQFRAWSTSLLWAEKDDICLYNNSLYRCIESHVPMDFGVDTKKWEIIYADLKEWKTNVFYHLGSVVIHETKLFKCIVEHTSVEFEKENSNWELLGGESITSWNINTSYKENDIILYNNTFFRCKTGHVSSEEFSDDYSYWQPLFAGIVQWSNNTVYLPNNIIIYNKKLYRCISVHTSSNNFNTDTNNWELISGTELIDWEPNIKYFKNQLLYHNKLTYRIINDFTSGTSFDSANLEILNTCYIENWKPSTNYYVGMVVLLNSKLLRCKTEHTSSNSFNETENSNWESILSYSLPQWTANTYYSLNDIVIYSYTDADSNIIEQLYICNTSHTSKNTFNEDSVNWIPINNVMPIWTPNHYYHTGEIVKRIDNRLFMCVSNHTSTSSFSDNFSSWKLINAGIAEWKTGEPYHSLSIVLYGNKLYKSLKDNVSSNTNQPDTDKETWVEITGGTEIDIDKLSSTTVIQNWSENTSYVVDQMVLYNNTLYRNKTAHTSGTSFAANIANWDLVYSRIVTWVSNITYKEGDYVRYNNVLYRCKITNTNTKFVVDNWELVDNIQDWAPRTNYVLNTIVVYNNTLWQCIESHVSDVDGDFEEQYWRSLSDLTLRYIQYEANSIVGPATVNIPIEKAKKYIFPPISVLKNMSKGEMTEDKEILWNKNTELFERVSYNEKYIRIEKVEI